MRPVIVGILAMLSLGFARVAYAHDPIDFSRQIRPLFETNCVACHSAMKQKAGLKLDLGKNVLKGSLNGPVVISNKSADSKLIHALMGTHDLERMPPDKPLPERDIQLIIRWIDEGATIPVNEFDPATKHWAYEVPKKVDVPKGTHPIDHLLAKGWQKQGLTPAQAADPAILIRRLHLDLTGLPPRPEQVNEFRIEDYEKRADELLASEAYGERWGRHLLDVWRYSDWYGFGAELRNSQKHIWNWRDWVVESLNANRPYDRMIREMLAGDEIAPGDVTVLRATGYLSRSYYKFNRNVWLDDIVEHTGKAFLGITLNCCRCHNHMYDPISQEDYFRFRAIFEPHQTRLDPLAHETDPEKLGFPRVYDADLKAVTFLFERGNEKQPKTDKPLPPGVPVAIAPGSFSPKAISLPPEVIHPTLREAVRKSLIEQAAIQIKQFKTEPRNKVAVVQLQAVKAKLAADTARYTQPPSPHAADLIRHAVALHLETMALAAEAELAEAEETRKAAEVKKDATLVATQTKNVDAAKAKVVTSRKACETPPGDYQPLMPNYPEMSTGRRTALANWIASKDNPLTARVFVNHVWSHHFGQPLVPTMFDFGKNGRPPSNPALLDWLAVEFMQSGWDVKKLHRLILTSRAYRMRSSFNGPEKDENHKRDPDNLLLWKMNPRPLEAEAIRDSLLAVSGLLDAKMGGPDQDHNDDLPKLRRSIYSRHAPEKVMPFLAAFDAASPTECYRRANTVVPQQAMALVNSKLSARAADAVANRLSTKDASNQLLDELFGIILSRKPRDEETKLCLEFLKTNSTRSLVLVLFNHVDFTTIR